MIRVESRGAVRVVTIDRPDKRNALTVKMLGTLMKAVMRTAPARAIVLLGTGPVFCSGFDLNERKWGDRNGLATLRSQLRALAGAIDVMSCGGAAVVVGVQGAAVAGGCALLGGADVVVAERSGKVGYPVLRLGISPAVTAPYLRGAVGDGAVRSLLLDPTLISAERAHELGLVHELVNGPDAVAGRAIAIAEALAAKPGRAVSATRMWLKEIETGMEKAGPQEGLAASLNAIDDETATRLAGRK